MLLWKLAITAVEAATGSEIGDAQFITLAPMTNWLSDETALYDYAFI